MPATGIGEKVGRKTSKTVMSSAEEGLQSEGLITVEENAGQLEAQTAES